MLVGICLRFQLPCPGIWVLSCPLTMLWSCSPWVRLVQAFLCLGEWSWPLGKCFSFCWHFSYFLYFYQACCFLVRDSVSWRWLYLFSFSYDVRERRSWFRIPAALCDVSLSFQHQWAAWEGNAWFHCCSWEQVSNKISFSPLVFSYYEDLYCPLTAHVCFGVYRCTLWNLLLYYHKI